jgi:DNA-binding NarL/FixJ family response regulator
VSPAARILLVDDHPLVREGLAEVLQREGHFCVCGQAEDAGPALDLVASTVPDLAIVDLALKHSNGLELIKDIRSRFPRVAVLVVSMQDEVLYAERALRAGASGYLHKGELAARVVEAARLVLRGQIFLSQQAAAGMVARLTGHASHSDRHPLDGLSDRELEVLELIGEGLARHQIAARLHLDVSTVETYRSRLKEKLQLSDAQELLQFAIRSNRACPATVSPGLTPAPEPATSPAPQARPGLQEL